MGNFYAQKWLTLCLPELHWPELSPKLTARKTGECELMASSATEIKRYGR